MNLETMRRKAYRTQSTVLLQLLLPFTAII